MTKLPLMISPDFNKCDGLIPAVVQDFETKEVLMLAYMNETAWEETVRTGIATYWSRSRQELWVKGKTSGHTQVVKEIRIDCDLDTVLLSVEQIGKAACHTGYRSCFYQKIVNGSVQIDGTKIFDPKEVYK